jgi:hypothetical protein
VNLNLGQIIELERELEEKLRAVRLVCELDLEGRIYDRVLSAVRTLADFSRRTPDIFRRFPAILVVYLVAEGVHRYKEGTYWPNLTVPLIPLHAGPEFEDALRRLNLETFEHLVEDEHACRYIAPILAHGGIPRYCVGDFFRVLFQEMKKGISDADDLMSLWRTRETQCFAIDMPVRRFLLYGGELARDLVGRCIELIQDPPNREALGLPRYIVEAFAEGDIFCHPEPFAVPRPFVTLDPWDTLGPVLELPAVSKDFPAGHWEGNDGRQRFVARASYLAAQTVRINPAASWHVTIHWQGEAKRSYAFESLQCDKPVLFFDPSNGRLVRNPRELRLDSVWALLPEEVELWTKTDLGRALPLLEEFPQPTGAWEGCRLAHYDLRDVSNVSIVRAGPIWTSVPVVAPAERPMIHGPLVAGVTTSDGLPVYSAMPRITVPKVEGIPPNRWQVRLRRGEVVDAEHTVADLAQEGDCYALSSLLPTDSEFGVFDLYVRGPLGFDLRANFAVIPLLVVERPDRVLMPDDPDVSIRITSSPDWSVEGAGAGTTSLSIPQDEGEVLCAVRSSDGNRIALRVAVPRLLWATGRIDGTATSFGNRPVSIDADDLLSRTAVSLMVRTRRQGARLCLALHDRHGTLQRTEAEAKSDDGRWSFDLARMADTIFQSQSPTLTLRLSVDGRAVEVANIHTRLEVREIRASSQVIGGFTHVQLTFAENRQLQGRVLRLWSLDRPWEAAVAEPIPDDCHNAAEISRYGHQIPPGRYIAEITVDDAWTESKRPKRCAVNTAVIDVGSYRDVADRRARIDLADPVAVLELAAATGNIGRELDASELRRIALPALETAVAMLDDSGIQAATSQRFGSVCTLLQKDLSIFLTAACESVSTATLTRESLLRVGIPILPQLRALRDLPVPADRIMREIADICPPLAATVDVPRVATDLAARVRCKELFGWEPEDGGIEPGGPVEQVWPSKTAEDLRDIRDASMLSPVHLLDLDSYALANFEWLLVALAQESAVTEWWEEHSPLLRTLSSLTDKTKQHFAKCRPPRGTEDWASFPGAVLAAAFHVVYQSPDFPTAVVALWEAMAIAPRLVTRDLVLAVILAE